MNDEKLYKQIIAANPAIDTGIQWLSPLGEQKLYKMIVCAAYRQGQIDWLNEKIRRMEREKLEDEGIRTQS